MYLHTDKYQNPSVSHTQPLPGAGRPLAGAFPQNRLIKETHIHDPDPRPQA